MALAPFANGATIGDEVTQRKYEEQAKSFVPALYYSMKLDSTKDRAVQLTVPPKSIHSSNGTVSGLAMRTNSNQVTAPQTNPRLYNPYEGDPNALQIGESVEDFLHHLPPSTTYAANLGPWLWAANFFSASRPLDTNPIPYIRIGNDLLTAHSTALKMQELEMPHHTKAAIANVAKQLKADTTKYLLQAARNCGVLVGKWMLFPYASEVDQVWEKVVRATVDGRLGISCKVATRESDDSGDVAFAARTRLVCVYTRDFGDEDDVKRVLNGLVEMGLVPERGGIWYKCGECHVIR